MMAEHLIPATVIGSWSFPGWFEKFIADVKAEPERFGPVGSRGGRARRGPPGRRRPAPRRARPDHRRRDAARRFQPGVLRVPARAGAAPACPALGRAGARPARPLSMRRAAVRARRPGRPWPSIAGSARYTDAPVKMPVPGPFTLAGCIDGGAVYADRDAVTDALIPIVNAELKALVAAGVDFIQLDEPSFACHPDAPESFLDVIGRTVEGVSAYISMHMCFGNYRARAVGHRSYRPLFPHIGRAPVNQLALEFASREMAEVELLARTARDDGRRRRAGRRQEHLDRAARAGRRAAADRAEVCRRRAGLGDARLRLLADRPARRGRPRRGRWSKGSSWSAMS